MGGQYKLGCFITRAFECLMTVQPGLDLLAEQALEAFQAVGLVWYPPGLAEHDQSAIRMDQIIMAVDAFFFISGLCVQYGPVGQHGTPFVGHMQKIAMAFLALCVAKRRISGGTGFFSVIFAGQKVDGNILDAVIGFGEEKIEGVLGRWQVAVHAVHHHTRGVVGMG